MSKYNFLLHLAFVNCIWNKEELPHQWTNSIIVPFFIRGLVRLTKVIIAAYCCCQLNTKFYPAFFSEDQIHMQMTLLEIVIVNVDTIDQLLVRYSTFIRQWRKSRNTMDPYISYVQTSGQPVIKKEGNFVQHFNLVWYIYEIK